MKPRVLPVLAFALVVSVLSAVYVFAAVTIFATGMGTPESITQTASGDFYITDANDQIWDVPAAGGTASQLASLVYSLRGGLFLPASFSASGVGGKFLVVGGDATSADALTLDVSSSPATTTLYKSQPNSFWTTPVLATSFGAYSGDVLVTNQGGSVDFFTPSGTVGRLAPLPSVNVPFGAALAPASFGDVGGTLLVSDAGGNGIYSVDSTGNVRLFTTIVGQSGLRQIAFAPKGWGHYGGNLFVSVLTNDIYVVDRDGKTIGKIEGVFNPRGLLFTSISGSPSLLFCDTKTGDIRKAGPGDVVPISD